MSNKPCVQCGYPERRTDSRFCSYCYNKISDEMHRTKYLTPRVHDGLEREADAMEDVNETKYGIDYQYDD